ncbi:MAG: hypothetical protein ACOVSW_15175 [Candidatus Kapaibacteriota bacterium]
MAFSQFKSLGAVSLEYRIITQNGVFVNVKTELKPSESFLERLPIILAEGLHKVSEYARCELLIAPLLYDVWLQYRATLKFWSHPALEYDAVLQGTPGYVIARQSELGTAVLGRPIMLAVEAKRDDFEEGWGQCAAEMVAAQRINADATAVFGIVTNGEIWQFAKLEGNTFTQEMTFYSISDMDKLFGALTFVMAECYKQVKDTFEEVV